MFVIQERADGNSQSLFAFIHFLYIGSHFAVPTQLGLYPAKRLILVRQSLYLWNHGHVHNPSFASKSHVDSVPSTHRDF